MEYSVVRYLKISSQKSVVLDFYNMDSISFGGRDFMFSPGKPGLQEMKEQGC